MRRSRRSRPARGRWIPIRACFRALRRLGGARSGRAEIEAAGRRAGAPRDLEPLLYLVRCAAERRGAHRKAIELLDEADAIDRVDPEVRQSRARLCSPGRATI